MPTHAGSAPSVQLGARGEHRPSTQFSDSQSLDSRHFLPSGHRGHTPPPLQQGQEPGGLGVGGLAGALRTLAAAAAAEPAFLPQRHPLSHPGAPVDIRLVAGGNAVVAGGGLGSTPLAGPAEAGVAVGVELALQQDAAWWALGATAVDVRLLAVAETVCAPGILHHGKPGGTRR